MITIETTGAQRIIPPETNPITQGGTLREKIKTAVADIFNMIGELFKKIFSFFSFNRASVAKLDPQPGISEDEGEGSDSDYVSDCLSDLE